MSLISFSRDKFIPSDEVSLNVRSNFLSIARGYQVFTFFKTVNNGKPVFLDDHINRVFSNANDMKMNISHSKEDIKSLVFETLEKNDFTKSECNVMIILAGTVPDDNSGLTSSSYVDLFIITSPIKVYPASSYENGISLGLYEYERIDAEIKTPFTYYSGVKAQQMHVKNGEFDEVLYTSNGSILEGTTFSFFAIKDDVVLTPKADGRILGSVTRKNLIRIMQTHQIKSLEESISTDDINNFSEAFIASANRDLIPVVKIDNIDISDGKVGSTYHKLMSLYQKEVIKNTI